MIVMSVNGICQVGFVRSDEGERVAMELDCGEKFRWIDKSLARGGPTELIERLQHEGMAASSGAKNDIFCDAVFSAG